MRLSRRNKITMWYSLYQKGGEPIYKTDEDGNIVYIKVDGEDTPVIIGKTKPSYSKPVKFLATISNSGGNAEAVEFGVSEDAYSAVIETEKDSIPIDELSRIWRYNDPTGASVIDGSTADYKVVKVSKNLNYDRYVLDKLVKG